MKAKTINIDFLHLDLSTCERCVATDSTLDEALSALSGIFELLGYVVHTNKVHITTRELAAEHHFLSSPTIRVNGVDIGGEIKENDCSDCGDLCGDSVECRVFVYEGKEYEQPPVAMIVDGVLRVMFSDIHAQNTPYVMPDNLEKYFEGIDGQCCCSGGKCC